MSNSKKRDSVKNSTGKKVRDAKYYRKALHVDTVTLTIIAVVAIVMSLSANAMYVFFKSCLFMLFYVILIANRKECRKFVGTLSIIVGLLMILTFIGDGSVFGIIYFIFGIFYIIHSIIFLVKLRKEPVTTSDDKKEHNKSLVPVINLLLIIISLVFMFVGWLSYDDNYYNLIQLPILLFVIIFSIICSKKGYKSAFLYITLVFAVICILPSALSFFDAFSAIIDKIQYKNSSKYVSDVSKDLEERLSEDAYELAWRDLILTPVFERDSYVLIGKNYYEKAIKTWNDKGYGKMSSAFDSDDLKDIVCDGYIERSYDYSYIDVCVNIYGEDPVTCANDLKKGDGTYKSFVKCTSEKYSYITDGFDETKLKNSKSKEYYEESYKLYYMKKIEEEFAEEALDCARVTEKVPTNSKPEPVVISKKEYEELAEKYNLKNKPFSKEEIGDTTCTGYVVIELGEDKKLVSNPYISCSGKYSYTTAGYDYNKLFD